MSTAKRSRRQTEAKSASALPASKRLKTSKTSHVPTDSGLGFLVDENARNGKKLEAKLTDGVPSSKTTRVDESHAVVAPDTRDDDDTIKVGSSQHTAMHISSDEESEDSEEDEDDKQVGSTSGQAVSSKPLTNGYSHPMDDEASSEEDAVAGAEDVDMLEPEAEQDENQEPEEPSFGDMLQAQHPDPIDVQASFPDPMADRQALIPSSGGRVISAPSGTSLGTVLTQALKTNDRDLLESCFQTHDVQTIRSTVQRLQSQHVATLLQRLAERIHKRPGRTGQLITWIQWSLIAHGAYLVNQPDVMKKLKSLSQVMRERANGLQPLLHLKGKLDMLSSQLDLRRSLAAASRAANADDDEDEEGVVYVEGEDDDDWSDSEAEMDDDAYEETKMIEPTMPKSKRQTATPKSQASDSDDENVNGLKLPNGVAQEDDDSSDAEEDDEAEEGMFDVEAEEAPSDENEDSEASDSEASSASEDEDESEPSDDESDASAGVKQPQPKTLNRKR